MTSPPAVRKRGVQPGSVEGATRISPGSSLAPDGSRITRALPVTTPAEAAVPVRLCLEGYQLRSLRRRQSRRGSSFPLGPLCRRSLCRRSLCMALSGFLDRLVSILVPKRPLLEYLDSFGSRRFLCRNLPQLAFRCLRLLRILVVGSHDSVAFTHRSRSS